MSRMSRTNRTKASEEERRAKAHFEHEANEEERSAKAYSTGETNEAYSTGDKSEEECRAKTYRAMSESGASGPEDCA